MSKSGLFAHFRSKEQLQLDTLAHARERFVDLVVRPALAAERGETRVRTLFEGWLDWASSSPDGGCIFVAATAELDDRPGELRDALVRSETDWLELIASVAGAAAAEGHFSADLDTEQFAFEVHGVMLAYHHARGGSCAARPRASGRGPRSTPCSPRRVVHDAHPDRGCRDRGRAPGRRVLGRPVVRTDTEPGDLVVTVAVGATVVDRAPEVPRPEGPAADISEQLTGGQGVFLGSSVAREVDPGYVEEEYAAAGRATAYESVGALAADGMWTFRPTGKAAYRTRIVVRRPTAPGRRRRPRRVAQRQRRAGRRPGVPDRPRGDRPAGAHLGRRLGAEDRRRGRGRRRRARHPRRGRRGGQGAQGHRPRALRVAAAPGRPVRLRHRHPGGAGPAGRRTGHRRERPPPRCWRWASRRPRSAWSPTSTASSR